MRSSRSRQTCRLSRRLGRCRSGSASGATGSSESCFLGAELGACACAQKTSSLHLFSSARQTACRPVHQGLLSLLHDLTRWRACWCRYWPAPIPYLLIAGCAAGAAGAVQFRLDPSAQQLAFLRDHEVTPLGPSTGPIQIRLKTTRPFAASVILPSTVAETKPAPARWGLLTNVRFL